MENVDGVRLVLLVQSHGSRKCDRGALKPTQSAFEPRNVKVKQLYNTPSDVQTQHTKIFCNILPSCA